MKQKKETFTINIIDTFNKKKVKIYSYDGICKGFYSLCFKLFLLLIFSK